MTDPDQKVEIDLDKLRAHRDRVHDIVGGIASAHGASHVAVGHDAFGAFGYFLADECEAAATEGIDMLGIAQKAADDLHQNLGLWARDGEHTEGEITALFTNLTKDV